MNKIKIMLLSLALFAAVGAGLAFKGKYTNSYCVTNAIINNCAGGIVTCPNTPGVPQTCILFENLTTAVPGQPGVRFCTTATNGTGAPCNGVTTCSSLRTFIPNT